MNIKQHRVFYLAVLFLLSPLFVSCSPPEDENSDDESIVTVQLDDTIYTFPRTYLGQANIPEKSTMITLHVQYPDLSPVGYTSHRCVHKVALSDTKCPYFSIFLESSAQLPTDYSQMINQAVFVRNGEGYRLFERGGDDIYRWIDADGEHGGYCSKIIPDQSLKEPFGHTTCRTWRKTNTGAAYEIIFDSTWRPHMAELDRRVSKLVDHFVKNPKSQDIVTNTQRSAPADEPTSGLRR